MNAPHQPGEIIADRYRIIETLGEGGNGITYKAELLQESQLDEAQHDNNRYVALKALSLRHMEDWKPLELFEREARILQHLNHHRIPRYLDYFHVDTPDNRAFYIVQELVEGQSLAAMVEKGWRTNEAGVRRIIIQVLEILVYLQDLKPPVIHRDIKPQNLIWGKDGQIFLVDFGAVRDTYKSTLARGSTVVGTFGYMAPEQFQGHAVPATDLYGLGATALFLLTHRSPAELPEERLKISFRSRVQISNSFADCLERAIEPDAGDRLASAREALGLLRGNVVMGKRRSFFPGKALVGIGVVGISTVTIFNYFPYAVLGILGFKPNEICEAASAGNLEIVRNYLNKGGSSNINLNDSRSLLDCALESKKIELIKLMIERGLNIDERNHQGQNPLHRAIISNQKYTIRMLIDLGADVNAKTKSTRIPLNEIPGQSEFTIEFSQPGKTPLHLAVQWSDQEVVKQLIDRGADVSARDDDGLTPLQWLRVRTRDRYYVNDSKFIKNVLDLLLSKGAEIDSQDIQGKTILNSSALYYLYGYESWKSQEFIELLIERGANAHIEDNHGYTVFSAILEFCLFPISPNQNILSSESRLKFNCEYLLDRITKSIFFQKYHLAQILQKTCIQNKQDNIELINILIDKNPDLSIIDEPMIDKSIMSKYGFTVLHFLAFKKTKNSQRAECRMRQAKFFIENGADVNARDFYGKTPLFWAIEQQNTKMIELLRSNGGRSF